MPKTLNIALAQINPHVGNIDGNVAAIRKARATAAAKGADLVVFCELVVSGYPTEDLVRKPSFQRACTRAVQALADDTKDGGPAMIIGAPFGDGGDVYNRAFLLDGGKIAGLFEKRALPNYGVFDEPRRFETGRGKPTPIDFRGTKIGVLICEDLWGEGIAEELASAGAEILVAPHGSPYRHTALIERQFVARARTRSTQLPLIFLNQLAGQDEVVFDGASFVMDRAGEIVVRLEQFEPDLRLTQWQQGEDGWVCGAQDDVTWPDGVASTYRAVVLGLRDYVEKNKFPGVVLGLSGGVDSAICAAIAADALGPQRVRCVMMPSRYTSTESLEDATACARALGASYESINIEPGVEAFGAMLAPAFEGQAQDTTEENIQSRCAACCSWLCPTNLARYWSPPAISRRCRSVMRPFMVI